MDARTHFDRLYEENREMLERAERDAIASGKEPFDLAKFERLLMRGPQANREQCHRAGYYIFNPELRTIAGYVELLHRAEPREDSN